MPAMVLHRIYYTQLFIKNSACVGSSKIKKKKKKKKRWKSQLSKSNFSCFTRSLHQLYKSMKINLPPYPLDIQ